MKIHKSHFVIIWVSLLVTGVTPVSAFLSEEYLSWSYNGHPGLEALFETEPGPMYGENSTRKTHLLRFVIKGESLDDWEEILEIFTTYRKDEPADVNGWYDRFKKQGDESCPGSWKIIEEQETSMIFERLSGDCPEFESQQALYRILYGKKKAFLIFSTRKGHMDKQAYDSWLDLLKNASVSK